MTPTPHEIICTKCGQPRPTTNFPHKSGKSQRRSICKRCIRQQRRTKGQCIRCSNLATPGYTRCERCLKADAEKAKAKHLRHRQEAINRYGGACKHCQENRLLLLTIDHINGGGNRHRQTMGEGGNRIYVWLRKHTYPNGFQVLCYNCNAAKVQLGDNGVHELFNPLFIDGAGI
jgi:hypothetical protein